MVSITRRKAGGHDPLDQSAPPKEQRSERLRLGALCATRINEPWIPLVPPLKLKGDASTHVLDARRVKPTYVPIVGMTLSIAWNSCSVGVHSARIVLLLGVAMSILSTSATIYMASGGMQIDTVTP
jgi:hypothetical protein